MGRNDDCIKTAGHLLCTAGMEEVLTTNTGIIEAAIVTKNDELRGNIPVAFLVKKPENQLSNSDLQKDLIERMRHDIGPLANFRECIFLEKLPKTKSGKIIRSLLKNILNDEKYDIPPTIEDPDVVHLIKQAILDADEKSTTIDKKVKQT